MGNKGLPGLVGLALLACPPTPTPAPLPGGERGGGEGAAPPLTRYTFSERHMGTTFKIMVYAPHEASAKRGARAAFARIAQLDGIMSDYRPASELMQLCRKAV